MKFKTQEQFDADNEALIARIDGIVSDMKKRITADKKKSKAEKLLEKFGKRKWETADFIRYVDVTKPNAKKERNMR